MDCLDSLDDLILIKDVVKNAKQIYNSKIGVRLSIKDYKLTSRFGIEYDKENFKDILNQLREINLIYSLHFHYLKRLHFFKYRIKK